MTTPSDILGSAGQAVLDLRALVAVSAFASKEETRYYLCGVLLEVGPDAITYVATDGHRLAAYHDRLDPSAERNTLRGQFIVATADCAALKPKNVHAPRFAVLSAVNAQELTVDVSGTKRTFRPIDGTFPDWRRIVPQETTGNLTYDVNGAKLASVDVFAKALDLGEKTAHWNGGNAAVFSFQSDAALCVLMPLSNQTRLSAWPRPLTWVRQ